MRVQRPFLAATLTAGAVAATLLAAAPAGAATAATPPTLYPVSAWPLTDSAMSKTAKDTVGGRTATIDPTYNGVTFTGSAGVHFNEHGLLDVAPSSALSPGSKDFSFGVTVTTKDQDANVFQAGTTTNGVGGDYFAKIEIAGAPGQTLLGVARCELTGKVGTSFLHITLVGTKTLADNKAHQVTCYKRASSAKLVVDGVVENTRNVTLGTIDLSSEKWTMGGKYTANTGTGDLLNGNLKSAFINIAH